MTEKKIFFMHIPKCAGTSILGNLRPHYGKDLVEVYQGDTFNNRDVSIGRGKVIFGHFGSSFISHYQKPKTTVTVLRNPKERVISHYLFWKSSNMSGLGPDETKRLSLINFLSSQKGFIRYQIENIQAWMLISDYRKSDRRKYTNYSKENLAEVALSRLESFDFVGVTESLQTSQITLNDLFGLSGSKQLNNDREFIPHMNKAKHKMPISELTDEEMDALEKLTDLDTIVYERAKQLSSNLGATRNHSGR